MRTPTDRWSASGRGSRSSAAGVRRLIAAGVAVAGALALAGGRHGRRATLRALVSTLAAWTTVRVLSRIVGPGRPAPRGRRAGRRQVRPRWLPSTDAAAAVAFAAAAGMEMPGLLVPFGAATALTGYWRWRAGSSGAGNLMAGGAVGIAMAAASSRPWPVAPRGGAELRPVRRLAGAEPSPTGTGLAVVVNPGSGPAVSASPAQRLRDALPDAKIIELGEGADLVAELRDAARGAAAIGAAGGDGTLNAAASVAYDEDLPFLAVPAGTLNHFARDLGVGSLEEAVEALREGSLVAVDLAVIDGKPFLNTASFGGYPELVDAREQLEERIGKWAALVVALVRVLARSQPLEVELDGRPRRLWLMFIGNCHYEPEGFGPSWRERLDDRELDLRLVDAGEPRSRLRLVAAVLTGRLGRCKLYEQWRAHELRVRSPSGPLRLARDGETFDSSTEFTIEKRPRQLRVYAPTGTG